MPSKGAVRPIDDTVEYNYYSYSTPGSQTIFSSSDSVINTLENEYSKPADYETNEYLHLKEYKQEKGKTLAPPPFTHQAACADFQPLGHYSTVIDCIDCGSRMPSRVFYENGTKTHISAVLMCILGLWCCAPLPYFVNTFRKANHYCGNCDHYLGSYPTSTTIHE